MSSSEVYKRKFEEILRIEERFRDLYAYDFDRIEDAYLSEKLEGVYKDEMKHVGIAKSIIGNLSE